MSTVESYIVLEIWWVTISTTDCTLGNCCDYYTIVLHVQVGHGFILLSSVALTRDHGLGLGLGIIQCTSKLVGSNLELHLAAPARERGLCTIVRCDH